MRALGARFRHHTSSGGPGSSYNRSESCFRAQMTKLVNQSSFGELRSSLPDGYVRALERLESDESTSKSATAFIDEASITQFLDSRQNQESGRLIERVRVRSIHNQVGGGNGIYMKQTLCADLLSKSRSSSPAKRPTKQSHRHLLFIIMLLLSSNAKLSNKARGRGNFPPPLPVEIPLTSLTGFSSARVTSTPQIATTVLQLPGRIDVETNSTCRNFIKQLPKKLNFSFDPPNKDCYYWLLYNTE
ncbi:hypothetical protein LguiA_029254 [Lonicera macranthoides]